MISIPGSDRVIVTIDLRGADPVALTSRRFAEVQGERAPAGDASRVDFSRVILLDDAARLTEHHEIYAHILDSHVDISLLCLAIGAGPDDDPTLAMRRPFQLGPPKAATLWVGDAHGIGWRMESTQADLRQVPGRAGASSPLLSGLIEILRLPQVFDRVLEVVGPMPGAAACPGIRLVRGDIDLDVLVGAQRAAIRRLTDPGDAGDPLSSGESILLVKPSEQEPDRGSDVIRPGGQIDDLFKRCRSTGHEADLMAGRVTGIRGLFSAEDGLRGALGKFADALGEFNGVINRILYRFDTRTGFEAVHREQLTRFGIELSRLRPVAPGRAVEAVRELTVTALEKHHPLPAIVVRLRDEADGLVPQGTSPYSERIGRICPDGAVRRLRQPPAVLPAAMSPGLLAATFAACLLSGLWPVPVALSGVIAVLGVGAGAAWMWSKASAIVPVPARLGWRFVLSQLAAAVAGSACGVALSRAGRLPVPAGPAGIASGAGVAVVVVFGLTMLWWSVLAGQWYTSLHLRRLTGSADMLRSLVVEVARDEWQMAGERAAASNYARVMAGIVDDAVSSLRDYASGLPDPGRGGGTRANPQAHERVSREIVLLDLGDAVADSVGRLAASVGFGSLKAAVGDMVQRELGPALHAYQAHLDTVGLHEAPPFARASEERSTLVKSLMERRPDMQELIRSDVRDERITQLCAPEQLTLLETDTLSAELITFAPRAARDFTSLETSWKVGRNAREHLIEWTSGSPVAGLLRLVPLRARAVEAEWPADTTSGGTTIRGGWRPPSPQEGAAGE